MRVFIPKNAEKVLFDRLKAHLGGPETSNRTNWPLAMNCYRNDDPKPEGSR